MQLHRLITLTAALFLVACSQTVVPTPRTGQHYFAEGEKFYEQENYLEAIASWEKVRESFHSPELTAEADYRIAEARFHNEDYLEASIAFDAFLEQHPDHAHHADALYYLGIANFRQLLTPDRDQTATRNARTALKNFTARYPKDPRAEEARTITNQCTARLAEHELYIGRFYLRTDHFQAAIGRLADIPKDYPDFPSLDLVYLYLGQAYLRNDQRAEARDTFNKLYKQFPDSKAVIKARKTLAEEY